jgi:hypothetical protein
VLAPKKCSYQCLRPAQTVTVGVLNTRLNWTTGVKHQFSVIEGNKFNAHRLDKSEERLEVADVWDILEADNVADSNRSRHQRQDRVLGATAADRTVERIPSLDEKALFYGHALSS